MTDEGKGALMPCSPEHVTHAIAPAPLRPAAPTPDDSKLGPVALCSCTDGIACESCWHCRHRRAEAGQAADVAPKFIPWPHGPWHGTSHISHFLGHFALASFILNPWIVPAACMLFPWFPESCQCLSPEICVKHTVTPQGHTVLEPRTPCLSHWAGLLSSQECTVRQCCWAMGEAADIELKSARWALEVRVSEHVQSDGAKCTAVPHPV